METKEKELVELLSNSCTTTAIASAKNISSYSGNNVMLKLENMQVTGSFKIRGAMYKITKLLKEKEVKGMICASAGNHGQGVAYAGKENNIPTIVVVPQKTAYIKIERMRKMGCEVIIEGADYEESYQYALNLQKENGYEFIHAFNDEDVIYGQGSVALEIFEQVPDVDIILVPCGGGGLLAGVCEMVKKYKPNVKVYGVEPAGCAAVYESVKKGAIVRLEETRTIAEGCAVKSIGETAFKKYLPIVEDIIRVSDEELVSLYTDMVEENKIVVEPSGLVSLAGAKYLECKGKNVVCILSGGNFDIMQMSTMLIQGLKNKSRLFNFSVLLPDQPGELLNVSEIVAQNNGNVVALDHNQFRNFSRNMDVELNVTVEAFGAKHKSVIIDALISNGYNVYEKVDEMNEYKALY